MNVNFVRMLGLYNQTTTMDFLKDINQVIKLNKVQLIALKM